MIVKGRKYACPECGGVNLRIIVCTYAKLVQRDDCEATVVEAIPGAEMWQSYEGDMKCIDCGEEADSACTFEVDSRD